MTWHLSALKLRANTVKTAATRKANGTTKRKQLSLDQRHNRAVKAAATRKSKGEVNLKHKKK